MPSKSYRDGFLNKLTDPEYASLYIETALEEILKDGNVPAFKSALLNVIEAASRRQASVADIYLLREQTYRTLEKSNHLTVQSAIAALKTVGITPEMDDAQLVKGA